MVRLSFYPLLQSIPMNNWKYFFPNSGISAMIRAKASMNTGSELIQTNEERLSQFKEIMEMIAMSFKSPSLTIFKNNLALMEELNTKCLLYQNVNVNL